MLHRSIFQCPWGTKHIPGIVHMVYSLFMGTSSCLPLCRAPSSTLHTHAPGPPSRPPPLPPHQVGAQTETELKEKKLRVEDALNATKAAVEEGERLWPRSCVFRDQSLQHARTPMLPSAFRLVMCLTHALSSIPSPPILSHYTAPSPPTLFTPSLSSPYPVTPHLFAPQAPSVVVAAPC